MKPSDNEFKSLFEGGSFNHSALDEKLALMTDHDEKLKYLKSLQSYGEAKMRYCDREIKKILKENENDPEFMAEWMKIKNSAL